MKLSKLFRFGVRTKASEYRVSSDQAATSKVDVAQLNGTNLLERNPHDVEVQSFSLDREDSSSFPQLTACLVSQKGASHVIAGEPRQDSIAYKKFDDKLAFCVSDGLSSAKRSQVGSQLVVRKALDLIGKWQVNIEDLNIESFRLINQEISKSIISLYVKTHPELAVTKVMEDTGKLRELAVMEFGATLELIILSPGESLAEWKWVYARVSGDGMFLNLNKSGEIQMLSESKKNLLGIFRSDVSALPLSDEEPVIERGTLTQGEALVLTTDGLGDWLEEWLTPGLRETISSGDLTDPNIALSILNLNQLGADDDKSAVVLRP
jgi:serine/threonine protein phosphatase PrpC